MQFDTIVNYIECPHCKKSIRYDSIFCTECGTKIEDNEFYLCQNCFSIKQTYISDSTVNRYNINNLKAKDKNICNLCEYPMKTFTKHEYNKQLNYFLLILFDEYDVESEELLIKATGLDSYQFKHIESIILTELLYNIISKYEISKRFNSLKQDMLKKDIFNINVLELCKEELINQFDNKVFTSKFRYMGEIKKQLVSKGYTEVKPAHFETKPGYYEEAEGYYTTEHVPVTKSKHGAGTKVAATLLAGPLGLIATTGVKTDVETRKVYHGPEKIYHPPEQYWVEEKSIYHEPKYKTVQTPDTILKITLNKNEVIVEENYKIEKLEWSMVESFEDKKLIFNKNIFSDQYEFTNCFVPNFSVMFKLILFKALGTHDDDLNNELLLKYNYKENIQNLEEFFYCMINKQIKESKPMKSENIESNILDDSSIDETNEQVVDEELVAKEVAEEVVDEENTSNDVSNQKIFSPADELIKYAELYEKGFLTEEEFNQKKKELL